MDKTGPNQDEWTQNIVGKSATNGGVCLAIDPLGNLFAIGADGNGTYAQANAMAYNDNCDGTYSDNKWHFVVGHYDGSTIKLYVDGQLKGQTEFNAGTIFGDFPFLLDIDQTLMVHFLMV